MKVYLIFVLSLMACNYVVADSWAPANLKAEISQNGRYVVRVIPGDSMGDVYGFGGSKKGSYAKAEYYKYTNEGYIKFREFELLNPISPLFVAITNTGSLITLDNWHNMGYGEVVIIYKPNGSVIKKYKLTDIYTESQLKMIRMTTSSLWWRCKSARPFYDAHSNTLVVNDALGGRLEIDVSIGRKNYSGKGGSCIHDDF